MNVDIIKTETFQKAPIVLIFLLTLFVFWMIAKFTVSLIYRYARRAPAEKKPVYTLMANSMYFVILIVGVITALGSAGVNVSALVASLGLGGLALSFATKDTFSSLLAGIVILLYQPFKIGNKIQVGDFKGEVINITLRYTHLRDETNEVLIPNSSLMTHSIVITHR